MKKLLLLTLIFLSSCSLDKVVQHHGVHNLEKKQAKLKINYTNKNLWTVASRYECVVPIIDTEFKVRSVTSKMRIPEIV